MKSERDDGILRYVPQRFLAPWLSLQTAGIPHSRRDRAIVSFAAGNFKTPGTIPYRVEADRILMDPLWHEYFCQNIGIMRALGERELIRFLQARNPTVPGIPDKISDARRRSLAGQTAFWKTAVEELGLRCFYSGEPMAGQFSLDHFVPWSFVVHDRIWNLVPARRSVNSSKGVRIPDEKFVQGLCELHLRAVRNAMGRGGAFSATSLAVDYETDLRIDLANAPDEEILAAHRDAVLPLVILAKRSGFTGGWVAQQPGMTI